MRHNDRRLLLGAALSLAAACVSWSAGAAAEEAEAVREQFRAAYAAAAAARSEADDGEALRAYVLYPYLRAMRIERALQRAEGIWHDADAAAAEFLAELGAAPVTRALRRAWLASLARRESWAAFLEQYDSGVATLALECQQFNARLARGATADVAAAIRARWLTGYRLPTECEPAFQWLRAQGELPDTLVAERATLLLNNGQTEFARVVAARLPSELAAPLLERAAFIESPARMIDAFAGDASRDAPAAVVLEAWARLARNAPAEALARYGALAERVATPEESAALVLALAKGLAWDRRPEALEYFARVPSGALDDVGREWWARAAMWAGDWELVRTVIATLSPAQRSEWSWRYWAARAADESGAADTARTLYAAALGGDNYYSAMAAARLGERVAPRQEPIPLDGVQVDTIAAGDAFQRVRELTLVDLRDLAINEWHYGYALLPQEQRVQAIQLAARWQIYDVAVALASDHGHFNDYTLLYPRPYADEVAAAAKLTRVEPSLLYGVLRQESLFRPDAASSAGALGIAQLTPATARETARRWQLPTPQRADLFAPAVGISLGAARIAELLERFDSQVPVALGAYNAGAAAAARWLPPQPVDSDVWIENIPYNETRAYVRRVLWHSLVFRWLETGRAQGARAWLGRIEATPSARTH